MPEYLAPGVYVEEIEIGGKPIEGVSTSTGGFLGETERGPLAPKLITNFEEFKRVYGGYIGNSYLPYAMEGFFANGGQRCFVARILGEGYDFATFPFAAAPDNVTESKMAVAPPSPTPPAKNGKPATPDTPAAPTPPPTPSTGASTAQSGSQVAFNVTATGPGIWGNSVAVKIEEGSLIKRVPGVFKLTVAYWKTMPPAPLVDPTDPDKKQDANRREPDMLEVFDNLSADPGSSDFYEKRINNISNLITIAQVGPGRPVYRIFNFLRGGKNGNDIKASDYQGHEGVTPAEDTGLKAFEHISDISLVCAPNENDSNLLGLTDAVVTHCELKKDRFAILNCKQSEAPISDLMPPKDSQYAAFYYPWIKIVDAKTGMLKLVPPGGHVAGLYARTDTERGVHKAPANDVLRGVMELQFPLSKAKQDILNPRGVNCIRAFPGRGIRVWGARTVSSDPLWKYVNVRRLFLYLEESIDQGTQWVVFEPNNEALWARVIQTITDFLTGVWKTGALMGLSPGEAFFVKCDRTTMTQDDIDNGRLVCMIGVAPTKPAEFVIFRIAQWRPS